MPAPSLVIVQSFKDFMLNPDDITQIQFTVDYDISFVPTENAPPQAQQAVISVPIVGLTKTVVKSATQNYIIAAVTALGGSIVANRIFSIADLV